MEKRKCWRHVTALGAANDLSKGVKDCNRGITNVEEYSKALRTLKTEQLQLQGGDVDVKLCEINTKSLARIRIAGVLATHSHFSFTSAKPHHRRRQGNSRPRLAHTTRASHRSTQYSAYCTSTHHGRLRDKWRQHRRAVQPPP